MVSNGTTGSGTTKFGISKHFDCFENYSKACDKLINR